MLESLATLASKFGIKGALIVLGIATGLGIARVETLAVQTQVNDTRIAVLEGERVDVARLQIQLEATNSALGTLQLQISDLKTDIRELRTDLRGRRP